MIPVLRPTFQLPLYFVETVSCRVEPVMVGFAPRRCNVVLYNILDFESEINFVEHPFSFRIDFSSYKACTLLVDPTAQLWVFLVPVWHIAYNAGGQTGGLLVRVFKMKIKRSTVQNNSQ
jgi:hypothetical protein